MPAYALINCNITSRQVVLILTDTSMPAVSQCDDVESLTLEGLVQRDTTHVCLPDAPACFMAHVHLCHRCVISRRHYELCYECICCNK